MITPEKLQKTRSQLQSVGIDCLHPVAASPLPGLP